MTHFAKKTTTKEKVDRHHTVSQERQKISILPIKSSEELKISFCVLHSVNPINAIKSPKKISLVKNSLKFYNFILDLTIVVIIKSEETHHFVTFLE